jgi:hypothetical protein
LLIERSCVVAALVMSYIRSFIHLGNCNVLKSLCCIYVSITIYIRIMSLYLVVLKCCCVSRVCMCGLWPVALLELLMYDWEAVHTALSYVVRIGFQMLD